MDTEYKKAFEIAKILRNCYKKDYRLFQEIVKYRKLHYKYSSPEIKEIDDKRHSVMIPAVELQTVIDRCPKRIRGIIHQFIFRKNFFNKYIYDEKRI